MKKLTVYIDGEMYQGRNIRIAVSDDDHEESLLEVSDRSMLRTKGEKYTPEIWVESYGELKLLSMQTYENQGIRVKLKADERIENGE